MAYEPRKKQSCFGSNQDTLLFGLRQDAVGLKYVDVPGTGFVQTLASPGIKMLRFPCLKKPRSWKSPGIQLQQYWNL